MKGFLNYTPGNSFFHKLNPLAKLILAFLTCIASFVCESHLFLLVVILLNLLLAASAGILKRGVMLLISLIKLSLLIFILQILFIREGNILIKLPLSIMITDQGISYAFLIVLRLIAATMPLSIMLSVTQMNDLCNVLVAKLKIPYKYAFVLITAIHFIPVFADEMSGIMEAQTARGVSLDTANIFKKISLILPLCVPLLITSVKKIEGSAISAELRGFHYRTKDSFFKNYKFSKSDAGVSISSVLLVCFAFMINNF